MEVRVSRRTDEDYVATPLRGFGGSGSRLGGVVPVPEPGPGSGPGPGPAPAPQIGMPGAFPATESSSLVSSAPLARSAATATAPSSRGPESVAPRFSVDQTKPTTSVQVRLADGTRFELSSPMAFLLTWSGLLGW